MTPIVIQQPTYGATVAAMGAAVGVGLFGVAALAGRASWGAWLVPVAAVGGLVVGELNARHRAEQVVAALASMVPVAPAVDAYETQLADRTRSASRVRREDSGVVPPWD